MRSTHHFLRPHPGQFNFKERRAEKLDSPIRVYEKLDGSIATMYYYDDSWHVASNKLPAADGSMPGKAEDGTPGEGSTFASTFWSIWDECGYKFPSRRHRSYIFEMCTPTNIIVCRHDKASLTLIGCRSIGGQGTDEGELAEVTVEQVADEEPQCGFRLPRRFDRLTTVEAVAEASHRLNPLIQEGYVVCDALFRRIKVKAPAYVALHHLPGDLEQPELRRRRLMEIIRSNEGDEFLSYYPSLQNEYSAIKLEMGVLEALLDQVGSSGQDGWEVLDPRGLEARAHNEAIRKILRSMSEKCMSARSALRRVDIRIAERALEATAELSARRAAAGWDHNMATGRGGKPNKTTRQGLAAAAEATEEAEGAVQEQVEPHLERSTSPPSAAHDEPDHRGGRGGSEGTGGMFDLLGDGSSTEEEEEEGDSSANFSATTGV